MWTGVNVLGRKARKVFEKRSGGNKAQFVVVISTVSSFVSSQHFRSYALTQSCMTRNFFQLPSLHVYVIADPYAFEIICLFLYLGRLSAQNFYWCWLNPVIKQCQWPGVHILVTLHSISEIIHLPTLCFTSVFLKMSSSVLCFSTV